MNEVTTINTSQQMTSKEIAEYTGKRHDNVMRDTKKLIDEEAISLLNFEERDYKDDRGKSMKKIKVLTQSAISGYPFPASEKIACRVSHPGIKADATAAIFQ